MKRSTIALALGLAVLAGCSNGKSSNAASGGRAGEARTAASAAATPDCNGQSPVWAVAGAKVYLTSGDRRYGKTKRGEYLCLSQALAEGYRHARRPHHRHHRENVF